MTRKDYTLLADALLKAKTPSDGWQNAVVAVADALKFDNPAFCPETFFAACGTTDYRGKRFLSGKWVREAGSNGK